MADIDETLTLITTGRYGRCRRCHAEIPIHLLQTIPTSRWCLNCRQHLTPRRCTSKRHTPSTERTRAQQLAPST
ncbi:TraR/DksA C4-type zinc finger protein [Nocardia sp. NPDC059228]|uniref:TraR/DksA C4-type zinc finger protein n=1 Tax=Nocardia sp. NPDC059228 TaxID=3346777 RepID=UPI00369DC475